MSRLHHINEQTVELIMHAVKKLNLRYNQSPDGQKAIVSKLY